MPQPHGHPQAHPDRNPCQRQERATLRRHTAVADDREIIVHYEVDTIPCRLILPYGTRRWLLDVAAPDKEAGRPWIFRWNGYARGLREGDKVIRHRPLYAAGSLSKAMLQAVEEALRFIEAGPQALTH